MIIGEVGAKLSGGRVSKTPITCFSGMVLRGCVDHNTDEKYVHPNVPLDGGIGPGLENPFCLRCCDDNRFSVATTEVHNMSCPFTMVNKVMPVAQAGPVEFRFDARATVDDDTVYVSCDLERDEGTVLAGYNLTIFISERSDNWGFTQWVSVLNCSVEPIIGTPDLVLATSDFHEYITIINVPEERTSGEEFFYPLGGLVAIGLFMTIPCYKGRFRGERCANCGSWIVIMNSLCIMCIVCGCRLHAPPAKVFSVEAYKEELKAKEEK